MKKLYLLVGVMSLFFVTNVSANFIATQNLSSYNCDEGQISIYLDEDNDNDSYHDKDIFLNSNFEYSETTPPSFQAVHIRNDDSKVQYVSAESNMLYSLKGGAVSSFDNTLFSRAALAFPYNTWIRGMDSYPNKVVFEQPINNINNDEITINYHYIYKLSNGRESNNNYNYWYNQPANYLDHSNNVTYCTLGSTPAPCSSTWSYKERSWFPNTLTKNTCVDIDLFWCGDGELQTSSQNFDFGDASEQCDPADTNHQGWGTEGCSNACLPINQLEAPACESITPTNDPLVFEPGVALTFTCHGNSDTSRFRAEIHHNGSEVTSLTETKNTDTNHDAIFTKTLSSPSDNQWQLFCIPLTANNVEGSPICERDVVLTSELLPPTCDLDIINMNNGSYNVDWNIVGTFNSPTQITVTPPLVNEPTHVVTTNIGTWVNLIPTGYGNFLLSMTVTNAAGSNTCTDTFFVEQPQNNICGDGNIDWPNTAGVYEECDNGPGFGNGCAGDCTLITPSCTLYADSQFQMIGNPVTFTADIDTWMDYYSFDLGNTLFGVPNIIYTGDIIFPYEYMYLNMGSYSPILTVQNNLVPIATGVIRPTAICETDIDVVAGCHIDIEPQFINLGDVAEISWTIWPDFNVPDYMEVSPALVGSWPHNIYYKTGNTFVGPNITSTGEYTFTIGAWTINGYEFSCENTLYVDTDPVYGNLVIDKILLTTGQMLPGDFVDYRIELTNNGDGTFYDAYILDVLPGSLDLISHNLIGIYPFTSADWQDSGNWVFEYSGFDLAPGQMVYVNVRGKVREGASANDTTNCAITSGDFDCEIYGLSSDPYILKSQMMSNTSISTNFTTGNISVNAGDYITYRVDFANHGGENTTGGVRVVDHMPVCIEYVSANIYGVLGANFVQTQDINGRWVLEYNDFDLAEGQAGYMIVTGQVIDTAMCDTINTYTNDSYIYFHNPMIVDQSSTTAIRADHSIVNVTKDSNIHTHLPGNDKLFVVQVENFGPNPISNIVLDDVRPAGTCITYVDRTGAGFTKDPLSLEWTYAGILASSNSLTLYISGSIVDNAMCVNPSYENIVNLRYTELGIEYQDQANYHFAVGDIPLADISLMKTVDSSSVSAGDTIVYTIVYQNVGNTILNSYVITDYWPGMVDFTTATPFPDSVVDLTTGSILQWNFSSPLLPGQTGEIVLEGTVF